MKIPHKRNGFTLVELLVTITIIAALAAVAVLASRSAQLSASKVADMANLRSLSTAAMAAGTDNAGRLPSLHSGSYAPYWLLPRTTLESYGISKEGCYAPTRGITGGSPGFAWWTMSDSGTPTHYVYFANDGNSRTSGWSSQGSVVKPLEAEYRGSTPYQDIIKDPARAFVRSVTDDAWYTVLWTGLCRDYGSGGRVGAIMQSGKVLGINTMYVDGHAEWIPIKKIKVRYTSNGLSLLW